MSRSGADPFVERVREANDIVEVVGSQIELRHAGSQLRGLCPFHGEKTPSFFVSADHQTYHCFGCGVGGDVFSFVMQQESMTFPEALRFLADRAGIDWPRRGSGPSRDRLERIREALGVARDFYCAQYADSAGEAARRYIESRGFGPEIVERYGLGFAPDSWDGLLRHAKSLVSERALVDAGLAIEGDRGRVYDRFRNRVVVPIETAGHALVGFGGRILGDGEPKYLNSPETPAYKKGSVLFGVPQAREAIRDEKRVIVVEGYFDVLGLVQGGVGAVVGTCGTALTSEQAGGLARYGRRTILLFDADSAGRRAALRALPVVASIVEDVRVAFPPDGLDPDDWIREQGRDAVEEGLGAALTPVAFFEAQVDAGVLSRGEAAGQAVQLLTVQQDPLVRDLWVQEISGRFGLSERSILERMHQATQEGRKRSGDRKGADGVQVRPRPAGRRWKPLEAACLRAALEHSSRVAEMVEIFDSVRPRQEFMEVLHWIQAQAAEAEDGPPSAAALVHRAMETWPDGGGLSALSTQEDQAPSPDPDALLDVLAGRRLKFRMAQVTRAIRRAQDGHDEEELRKLLIEKQELAAEQAARERRNDESETPAEKAPRPSPSPAEAESESNESPGIGF